jgi:hypothetical protein
MSVIAEKDKVIRDSMSKAELGEEFSQRMSLEMVSFERDRSCCLV